jgi:transcriptional regulator with XRE-family HTH domain
MPRVSKLKLPPIPMGEQSVGRRLAQLRKQRGYTQKELAKKMGLIQSLVSSYELNKLRLTAEMLMRFSIALGTGVDAILGTNGKSHHDADMNLSLVRRMKKIESLPASKRKALLQTIDGFLKAEER